MIESGNNSYSAIAIRSASLPDGGPYGTSDNERVHELNSYI